MKILILTNQPYPYMTGGSTNKLIGETKYLQRAGCEIILISSRGGNKRLQKRGVFNYAKIKQVGFPYVALGKNKGLKLLGRMFLWTIINITYFILSFIHSLFYIKQVDVISIKGIQSDGLCGVLLKKLFKKRLVYEHAGGLSRKRAKLFKQHGRGKWFSKLGLKYNNLVERIVYKNCDAIMTQENMEDYYRRLGFMGDYHIIPNGRDTEEFYPQSCDEIKKEYGLKGKVILFVGRLAPVKNIDKIIEAFSMIKQEASLVIVGDGEMKEELHKKASQSLGPNSINFVGAHKDVVPFYNAADVLVIASDYEGFPGVLIEAMACEKVVVASPVGVIPQVIKAGENGYLLPKHWDLHDLSFGMIKGINAPNSIKINAKKTMKSNYSWDVVIKKFISVYNVKNGNPLAKNEESQKG